MEIEKNYSILKACRFCPMCRHLCSSGNISMHESDFPRGRSLILYSVFRGEGYNRDYVNALFNCHMCGSCLAGCEGSFNLPELIRLSRMDIADEGMTPELIRKMKDNILKTENYFGENFTKSFTSGHSSEEKKNAEI
ncbi:MAG: hypothetical protein FJW66_01555, partial [Actinobacteria bacterium]|nr:hypothetical protein [Actinomycetota bacterium]